MYFRPGSHKEAGLSFSPIKAIVSPRPIGWISSFGKDGSINLAPYSYFNAISELPPMIMFSSAPSGNAQHKDHSVDIGNQLLQGDRAHHKKVTHYHHSDHQKNHNQSQPGNHAPDYLGKPIN